MARHTITAPYRLNYSKYVIVNMFIYFFKTQKHILQIGSYIHDDSQIFFTGNYGHDLSNQRAQQYELFAKKLHPNDTYLFYANRSYTTLLSGLAIIYILGHFPRQDFRWS